MGRHGPLTRYVKLRVAHAPGMPGTFFPPPRVSDPGMHHGTCVTRVPWCMPGSLTGGFFWSRWRGKRSRHSRRMRNQQFYLSGNRSMPRVVVTVDICPNSLKSILLCLIPLSWTCLINYIQNIALRTYSSIMILNTDVWLLGYDATVNFPHKGQ